MGKFTPKFLPGDKVRFKTEDEVREILGFSYANGGFSYTLTAKEVNVAEKRVIEGSTEAVEADLISIKEKEDD